MKTVPVNFYLVIGQEFSGSGFQKGKPSVRVTKTKPDLGSSEVCVAMKMELPTSLFMRPNLSATIVVPENQAPFVITPEIEHDIARAVKDQCGLTMLVSAAPLTQGD